jgi:hypothetical protein
MTSALAVLIVAHPGHELRLFDWMQRERPLVFILSDGSGGAQSSRLDYSASAIRAAGATLIEGSGQRSDREWYAAILAGDIPTFTETADTITAAALTTHAPLVVSDAADGYNPLHDLCQAIAGAVVARIACDLRPPEFLVSPATESAIGTEAIKWKLDAEAVRRKRLAMSAYTPLTEEVARLLAEEPDALHTERLLAPTFDWPENWAPEWEAFGRKRVNEGRFAAPITYRDHVLPIAKSLPGYDGAQRSSHCASTKAKNRNKPS